MKKKLFYMYLILSWLLLLSLSHSIFFILFLYKYIDLIDIKKSIQKVAQGSKTLGLAVPRNAFLLLIKFNAFGFATKIKKLIDKKGIDGINFWMQLGGNRTDLTKAVEDGAKKKAVLGETSAKADYTLTDGFGEPVTIAAALATAAPIVLKFKDILKQAGITDDQIAAATSQATAAFNSKTGQNIKKVIFEISEKRLGVTAVIENNKVIGIITDGDIRRMLNNNDTFAHLTAKDIMTKNPKTIQFTSKKTAY
jgi:hypothetical protein